MKHAPQSGQRRWTRHEYGRLIDHGFLDEDDHIELLDGLLLVKEPQHSPHRTAVLLVAKALERAFGEGWFVQVQSPIIVDDRSEPEPDVCVVRGSPRDYVSSHPRHPALVVEVAQSALAMARGRKATAYARADRGLLDRQPGRSCPRDSSGAGATRTGPPALAVCRGRDARPRSHRVPALGALRRRRRGRFATVRARPTGAAARRQDLGASAAASAMSPTTLTRTRSELPGR
jgi:hypothetical protein